MHVTQLEHEMSKSTHGEAGCIQRLPDRWQRTVDDLWGYVEGF